MPPHRKLSETMPRAQTVSVNTRSNINGPSANNINNNFGA